MKKLFLIFTLILSLIFTNSMVFAKDVTNKKAQSNKFTDISKHWGREAINNIVDKDLFTGKDGKFQPNKAITRSEFVLMLQRALGIQIMYFKATDIKEYYDDVKNDAVYASALYDLVTAGIIDYKDHFKPNSTISREEMVHFIMNAYRYKMGESYKEIKMLFEPFKDNDKLNPVYQGNVGRAEHMGLITRPKSNMFHPKDNTTRAQAATVIYRLVKLLEKENLQVLVTPSIEVKDKTLNMKLTVTNNTKTKVIIEQSSGQKFDFKLLDSDRNILYTWSADKMFTMALTETVIESGKSVEYSADLEEDIFNRVKGKAVYMKAFLVGKSDAFKINQDGYEAEIKW